MNNDIITVKDKTYFIFEYKISDSEKMFIAAPQNLSDVGFTAPSREKLIKNVHKGHK
jgi:hypothetical protein